MLPFITSCKGGVHRILLSCAIFNFFIVEEKKHSFRGDYNQLLLYDAGIGTEPDIVKTSNLLKKYTNTTYNGGVQYLSGR